MNRALVTGAAGFIGSALCKKLIANGWHVTGFDALTYAAHRASLEPEYSAGAMRLIHGDICEPDAVRLAFEQSQPTHVFHLAAETHVDRSIDDSRPFIRTNVEGTCTLLAATQTFWANGERPVRFVHVSTDEVFGHLGATGQFDESSPYDPRSPYSASKAAADHFVRAWHTTHGLPTIVTNCTNNYGPRQFPEKLIPLMTLKALANAPMPIYGKGDQIRDWLHVDDHADALIKIAEDGQIGDTYLIGAENEQTNRDIVYAIAAIFDKRFPDNAPHARLIEHVADRPGHDFRYAVSAQKLAEDLGWRPKKAFAKGLEATVNWYLNNPLWWKAIQSGTYRGERLGLVAN